MSHIVTSRDGTVLVRAADAERVGFLPPDGPAPSR